MQTRNPILDDLARVAAGALGVAAGMRKEAEELLKQRFTSVMGREGLVTREEFEAVKAMAAKARTENQDLQARMAKLEAAGSRKSPAKRGAAKSSAKPARAAAGKKATPAGGRRRRG
ncbi:MAG: accessory factor UbiK family protein [Alphaproteobacteria bacterium]|nr:accessory factor UbiK family protein [Pseudomonadota bacterium]TDI63529.1 MAG: accessory factor UbiK family protein [Alphaproteobacteria bacterium]